MGTRAATPSCRSACRARAGSSPATAAARPRRRAPGLLPFARRHPRARAAVVDRAGHDQRVGPRAGALRHALARRDARGRDRLCGVWRAGVGPAAPDAQPRRAGLPAGCRRRAGLPPLGRGPGDRRHLPSAGPRCQPAPDRGGGARRVLPGRAGRGAGARRQTMAGSSRARTSPRSRPRRRLRSSPPTEAIRSTSSRRPRRGCSSRWPSTSCRSSTCRGWRRDRPAPST